MVYRIELFYLHLIGFTVCTKMNQMLNNHDIDFNFKDHLKIKMKETSLG